MSNTLAEKSKAVTVTDPKVDASAKEKLVTARIGLLLRAPFFGNLATRMNLINADDWCPTAATDGRRFYYNSEFVNSLPLKQLEFLVGHEVLHAVYDHMGRRGSRDPKLWNIADDYCVNWDLVEQRVGDKIPVALYDSKYKGMSAEEVYDDLYENADKINIDDLMKRLLDEHLDSDGQPGEGDGMATSQVTVALNSAKQKRKKSATRSKKQYWPRHRQVAQVICQVVLNV
jgi:predicted metal-dependent peptidase